MGNGDIRKGLDCTHHSLQASKDLASPVLRLSSCVGGEKRVFSAYAKEPGDEANKDHNECKADMHWDCVWLMLCNHNKLFVYHWAFQMPQM